MNPSERKRIDMSQVQVDVDDAATRLEKEYLKCCARMNRIERQYRELLAKQEQS